MMPKKLAAALMQRVGVDRAAALTTALDAVRRGGTVSLSGVYGGQTQPLPLMDMFDKQLTLRMGQANVKRWIPDLMPLVEDDADPLGMERFATHHLPLAEAPQAYQDFQEKNEGIIKVVFRP
jgi:threonine dehydrogenase-like Zn-dependent dehydrogenase